MTRLVEDISELTVECSECNNTFNVEDPGTWFNLEEDRALCCQCNNEGTELYKVAQKNDIQLECTGCGKLSGKFLYPEHQFTDSGFECLECFDVKELSHDEAYKNSEVYGRWFYYRPDEAQRYLDNYMADLYEVHLDGEIHKGIPYWFEIPFKADPDEIDAIDSEDDIQLFHKCRSSAGYYCGVSEHIAPTSDDPNEYVRIDSERIGQELELQAEDGDFVYTSNEYDLGIYVKVPESIKGKEEKVNTFREQLKDCMTIH